jgi:CHASE2 domain-containing sensor protein
MPMPFSVDFELTECDEWLVGAALLVGGLAAVAYGIATGTNQPRIVRYSVGCGALSLVLIGIELFRKGLAAAAITFIVLAVLIVCLRIWR